MTSSLIRGRPRRAKTRIRARVTHAVLGAVAGVGWLVSPVMTITAPGPVPPAPAGSAGSAANAANAAAPQQDGTSPADLVLPLIAGGAAVVLGGYGYVRRTRRLRSRTTPGTVSVRPPAPAPADSERQARAALVQADDCVRTSREELSFVRERFGESRAEPFAHALRAAETELSAAFAIWRRYEQGVPEEADARRQALVGVIGRCAETGRRLDAEAPALDRLRGWEQGAGGALEVAEGRFRRLTARTAAAQDALVRLRQRYPAGDVTGYLEQAKDRLVFATAHLNGARQADDSGDRERAAAHLRAAEGAITQAGVLTGAVEGLADRLRQAAELVPAALTGGEAELAAVRKGAAPTALTAAPTALTAGELHARLVRADGVLAGVRGELTSGAYDPLDALRRITRAVARLEAGRSGVLDAAASLVAGGSVAAAEEFVAVHRGVVGAGARARLAEAVRSLAVGDAEGADTAARQARADAERDVRSHGTPYAGADGGSAALAGAVLGGILLAEDPAGGPPVSFGGPQTRTRHRFSEPSG
ncbi:hypothetical protein GCM10010503_04800 [Streptomyces lucensis JCM 4490]|uniref:Fibrillarin n=1 Tax=Streptomyces lucensis JCM 4490 TaxID=1306176 RepID=A0A918MKY3_9ACTN|nr:hypothetical protein [Streptomyces lucensis]GGW32098.1 hypothetical protein GCM10010503_04800 [Streptomyces lucensis JCM 4490]